jgi:hypothetical protein
MNRDPVTALTTLVLAAFLIERVASAATFLFSRPARARPQPEDAARSEWNRRLLYFGVSASLAIASLATVLARAQLLANLGLVLDPVLERAVLFVLLVGGADRISAIFKGPGGTSSKEPAYQPIEVRGTLRIDDSPPSPPGR